MSEQLPECIGVEAARTAVVQGVGVLPGEKVALRGALGRILRQDAVCRCDCPPADVSAVDGYGLASRSVAGASGEGPVRLRVVGTVKAGDVPALTVGDGECVAIMTGGILPVGVDAVVRSEDAQATGDSVAIVPPISPGSFVTGAGSFVRRGQVLRLAGRWVTAEVLAGLAASGDSPVEVSRKPRVGIMATGDELAACETALPAGRIAASNLPMLEALALETGCEVVETAVVGDNEAGIARYIRQWGGLDAVVTSGGVSEGRLDLVRGALRAAGARIAFSKIRMRPGSGTAFGRLGDCRIFCLPGNPMGALIAFLVVARPGLLAMMGSLDAGAGAVRLRTTKRLVKRVDASRACVLRERGDAGKTGKNNVDGPRPPGAHTWFVTARLVQTDRAADLMVEPLVASAVGGAACMVSATCLVRLGENEHRAEPGQLVDVLVFRTGGRWAAGAEL